MRNSRGLLSGLAITLVLGAWPAHAADLKIGKKKAQPCALCHGIDGIAKVPNAPHLAGENVFYLEEQLKNFRSGKREHDQMSIIAKNLSDDDIRDISAWYAAIKVTVELPKLD